MESLEFLLTALIVSDASVKNNVATSIAHIHIRDRPITKTLYYTLNIMSTEAKLVAIRCGINQATDHDFISIIIIVMDSIYAAKKIFDPSSHPFQKHMVSILKELCSFFSHHPDNHIKFWECPSRSKQYLHKTVDSETKSFRLTPTYPSKLSWNFSRKLEYDDFANRWEITFQASDLKDNQFLDLVDNDNKPLEPSHINGSLWLQNFSHSNSLCTRATRAITNHVPTGEYRLRFFPNEEFSCLCGQYPIESK